MGQLTASFIRRCPEPSLVRGAERVVIGFALRREGDVARHHFSLDTGLVVEAANIGALQIIEVLAHVVVQVVIGRAVHLMIPVGIVVHRDKLARFQPFAHLREAEQIALLVHHIGPPGGVYPHPLVEGAGVDGVDDVAVVDIALGQAGDIARLEAHGQIALIEHLRHHAAVDTPVFALADFVDGNGILHLGIV